MKRRLIFLPLATMIALIVVFEYSIRWLDELPWSSYLEDRWRIRAIGHYYALHPLASKDDDVRRTIKLAHFRALSGLHTKSLDVTLLDFNEAQNLIDEFTLNEGDHLELVDFSELILEKLSIVNRMNAILLQGRRSSPLVKDKTRYAAEKIIPKITDQEVRSSLKKELHLYDLSWHEIYMSQPNHKRSFVELVDGYHYGLARCAMHKEDGAVLIKEGVTHISNKQLIEITTRNIDHPLIAAASANPDSACAASIRFIEEKLKG